MFYDFRRRFTVYSFTSGARNSIRQDYYFQPFNYHFIFLSLFYKENQIVIIIASFVD
jgi:hypothetical protein